MRLNEEDQLIYHTTLSPYLASSEVQQMASYTQHGIVSTLSHCMNVAKMSLWLNRVLRIRADTDTLLAGALLHDFYLYDWHGSGWRHSYRQMAASVNDSVNEHMDQFVSNVVERSSLANEAIVREREKFERRLRSSRMGDMGVVVATAARRIQRVALPDETSGPVRQLEKMWNDLRRDGAQKE